MKTYTVSIPCCVADGEPNVTAVPDRWLHIKVDAESPAEALRRVKSGVRRVAEAPVDPEETIVG